MFPFLWLEKLCLLLWAVNNRGRVASILGHLLTSGRICSQVVTSSPWADLLGALNSLEPPVFPPTGCSLWQERRSSDQFQKGACSLTTLQRGQRTSLQISSSVFALLIHPRLKGRMERAWVLRWRKVRWCCGEGGCCPQCLLGPMWTCEVHRLGKIALSVSSASVSASATYSVFWWLPEENYRWPEWGR